MKEAETEVVPMLKSLSTTPLRRVGERMYNFIIHDLGDVTGQLHTPAALPLGKASPCSLEWGLGRRNGVE
jgi:hypothetical protein